MSGTYVGGCRVPLSLGRARSALSLGEAVGTEQGGAGLGLGFPASALLTFGTE